jgi:hypothetical protein
MAAKGLRLATEGFPLFALSSMWILANLAAGSSLPDHAKENGPRKHHG